MNVILLRLQFTMTKQKLNASHYGKHQIYISSLTVHPGNQSGPNLQSTSTI